MNLKDILNGLKLQEINVEDAKKEIMMLTKSCDQISADVNQSSYYKNEHIEQTRKENEALKSIKSHVQKELCFKEDIAIIGMSGRYPEASNLEEYWDNLAGGKNAIKEIPHERWDASAYYDSHNNSNRKINCKWMGALDGIENFDPSFFNISHEEAIYMDPQQRIFLQEGYRAFEDAGYSRNVLSNKKCGVYLGYTGSEYGAMLYKNNIEKINTTNNNSAIAAARIAYYLNLKGPAISIDTACSSSLVAVHLACQALSSEEINMALVGGVSLYIGPDRFISMCAEGMLSPQGKCKVFDNEANGFVPGEGIGALVLKKLKDAERDNDYIYGIIVASGINQNGNTNGITAPSKNSQIELEREVYEKCRVNPENITYAEMHGTGTKIGDLIELEALSKVFKEKTSKKRYCAVGSVKSNIGHTSAAAGVASIQKVLLCLKNKKLVPTLNFRNPNNLFDFENSPFYVNTELKTWNSYNDKPRMASVSSFGFSGSNAYVILKEYIPDSRMNQNLGIENKNNPILFTLSAKSDMQLQEYAKLMKKFINNNKAINLNNLGYTLQIGREAMDWRLALLVDSKKELIEELEYFIENNSVKGFTNRAFKGCITLTRGIEIDEKQKHHWLDRKNLNKLAEMWVKGVELDWNTIYCDLKPSKISIPTYPFACEKYWVSDIYSNTNSLTRCYSGISSDLIEKYSITPEEYLYSEPYFKEHKVHKEPVLIGMTHASLAINTFFKIFPEEGSVILHKLNFIHAIKAKNDEKLEVLIEPKDNKPDIDFKALYRFESENDWNVAATGVLKKSCFEINEVDIKELKESLDKINDFEYIYNVNPAVEIGDTFKPITEIYIGENEALARVVLNDTFEAENHEYILHPIVIYTAFQTLAPLMEKNNIKGGFLPFGIKDICLKRFDKLNEFWMSVKLKKYSGEMLIFDADIINEKCEVIGTLLECSSKRIRDEVKFDSKDMISNTFENNKAEDELTSNDPEIISDTLMISKKIEKYLVNKLKEISGNKFKVTNLEINLMDLGFDSTQLIELTNEIENEANIELTPALFFEYPNITQLTSFFSEQYREEFSKLLRIDFSKDVNNNVISKEHNEKEVVNVARQGNLDKGNNEDIAIIGMSGMIPGGGDLEEFWINLRDKKNLVKEIPLNRWNYHEWYDENSEAENKIYCKWGSFIDDVDKFDAEFFNISPREAEWMDPQLRLLLQNIYATGEESGYINKLRGSNTGVFIGVCCHDYMDLIDKNKIPVNPYIELGNSQTVIANRISFLFDIKGPSIAIDTACSSSLVAIHNACRALRNKECDMAFVGGTNLLLSSYHYRYFSSIGALSPTGGCHTFDEGADGYIPGECVASVLLKPLEQAKRDGDRIHAVIKGSAALHGGYTPSFTAPSVEGEENVIIKAWEDAKIDPATLTYIEAHGTGTKLGDPIEINSLKRAFKKFTQKEHFCAVGSAKANIGHTEGAAGIAGILKVILQMKHGQIPPLPMLKGLNPYIKLDKSPLYINREVQEWKTPDNTPRRAGISSFGISGTYAHVVLEEYNIDEDEGPKGDNKSPAIIVLSAKNKECLQIQACKLLNAINYNENINLSDISYTLQIGREAMEERLAMIVNSIDHLKKNLTGFIENVEITEGMYKGNIKSNKQAWDLFVDDDVDKIIDSWISKKKYDKLLTLWVNGLNFDWAKLYGSIKPRIVSLPTYSFSKERYWIPDENIIDNHDISPSCLRVINPLVHENTSDLYETRFTSTFVGNEFFLAEHIVRGMKVLPGVAYLEMARAGIYEAIKSMIKNDVGFHFKNVDWIRPIVVKENPVKVQMKFYVEDNNYINYEIYRENDLGKDPIIHCQGSVIAVELEEPKYLDLQYLQQICNKKGLRCDQYYEYFKNMGIEYGDAYKGIQEIYVDNRQSLTRLRLPESMLDTKDKFILHPSIMDSALQSTIGLIINSEDTIQRNKPMLPFELEELEVLDKCKVDMWAFTRYSSSSTLKDKVKKFDIDLCDLDGKVCVRIKGISSIILETKNKTLDELQVISSEEKDESITETTMLSQMWEVTQIGKEDIFPSNMEKILVVGGDEYNKNIIRKVYPNAFFIEIQCNNTIEEIEEKLKEYVSIDHIIWIVPYYEIESVTEESIIENQNNGIFPIFRTIKALLKLEYDAKNLGLTVITTQTNPIHKNDTVNPTNAGIYGLIGSLAMEYSNWKIRVFDLEKGCVWPVEEIFRIPADPKGNALVYRKKEWYRQKLISIQDIKVEETRYRHGGIYVVIGGAGGIGEAWSEYVVKNYKAQVIWIGRSKKNEIIEAKLDRLAKFGPRPEYISVDASDKESLKRAYEEIKEKYSEVQGVIHAAINLSDVSLANMEESQFKASLQAKIDVSVRLGQVFKNEPLDFIMFFSSVISFIKGPGQSNYAAGCTFKDAFAHQMSLEYSCSVKVVNWGYWGSVGVVASKDYQDRMIQRGIGSIEPPEAMETLEKLLAGPFEQIGLVKTIKPTVLEEMEKDEVIEVYNKNNLYRILDSKKEITKTLDINVRSSILKQEKELEETLSKLLLCQLHSCGLLTKKSKINDLYDQWLKESLRILERSNYINYNEKFDEVLVDPLLINVEEAWQEWESKKYGWLLNSNLKSKVILLEKMLKVLPEILTGKIQATSIMFPNSSMELLEGVYKNNVIADYVNELLADKIVKYIENRIKKEPSAQIRIIEIGAGTGGTSCMVLKKIKSYEDNIKEYCYTDVSRAFLIHAEKEYGAENPYLTYGIYNVEEAIDEQDIKQEEYDLVIAANVLHATRNIRKTLRNAKALLKRNGVILLNEISNNSLFAHLTFGLLEGWWLYEDAQVRIQGCPALSSKSWQRVLEDEGFNSISFEVPEEYGLSQQIIIAASDGVIRKKLFLDEKIMQIKSEVHEIINESNFESKSCSINNKIIPKEDISMDLLKEKSIIYIKKLVGDTLKISSSKINSSEPLEKYGIDSILVIQLTNSMRKVFDNIKSTLFFECQNIDDLVDCLIKTQKDKLISLLGLEKVQVVNEEANDNNQSKSPFKGSILELKKSKGVFKYVNEESKELRVEENDNYDIAIIGIAGRYPNAKNINEFWNNLKLGRNCINEIPENRWDWRKYYNKEKGKEGTIYSKWGGFIDDVDKFDPLFFEISPAEAEVMDPQERLFLETAYASIEDAGYTPKSLDENRRVGVFVGVMNGNYPTGVRYWSVANRVSYTLNFQGPSLAVDTACSSSLTAIHLAVESLRNGTSGCAIAGGVNLIVDPVHYMRLSSMSMLSATDKCRAFGDGADGFVDGEGVGAILLKPLKKAVADGDHIYGIVKGSMLNAGGKTNGYTVPNPKAQFNLINDCLKRSGVNARTVSYLEAHGTGTVLGDPIEILGLTQAFEQDTNSKQFCAIGSIKTNIGHLESAAGIAGVTKVLLQLKNQELVPSINAKISNPNIEFENTPFVVQQELTKWKRPIIEIDGVTNEYPRIAGISSFGAGGANAHVIIEEYIQDNNREINKERNDSVIVVLSAKNEEVLKNQVEQLLGAIQDHQISDNILEDMAYTLQIGRVGMEERLAISAISIKDLEEKLKSFLDGNEEILDVYRGEKKNEEFLAGFNTKQELQEEVDKWICNKQYIDILNSWVKGVDIDWNKLYSGKKPNRISLPTYPFAKERYWVDRSQTEFDNTFKAKIENETNNNSNVEIFMQEPRWQKAEVNDKRAFSSYQKHVILLCETFEKHISSIKREMPGACYTLLKSEHSKINSRFQDYCIQVFEEIKNILEDKPVDKVIVQIIVPNKGEKKMLAALSGLLKTAQLENPMLIGQLIQADEYTNDIIEKLEENICCLNDCEIQYTDNERWVKKLAEIEVEKGQVKALWKDKGIYLITGGAGKLGIIFAKEISRNVKNPTIILTGRSNLSSERYMQLKELVSLGARVEYKQVDITRKEEVVNLVQSIQEEFGSLDGIIHSAGVIHDNFIIKKTRDEVLKVINPKVNGVINLDEATKELELDFFILFSSGSAVIGNLGQCDYSAANAFMDEYSEYRNSLVISKQRSGKTLSINWPLWQEGGMSIDEETQKIIRNSMGIVAMKTSTGIQALYQAFTFGKSQVLIFEGDLQKMRQGKIKSISTEKCSNYSINLENIQENVIEQLKIQFSEVSKLSTSRIDFEKSLEVYGIDSIMITKLNQKLEAVFGGELSKTLFYEYKTIKDLSEYLINNHLQECVRWTGLEDINQKEENSTLEQVNIEKTYSKKSLTEKVKKIDECHNVKQNSNGYEPIAIIGMSGRYPQAPNIKEYWKCLKDKRDCITEIPSSRWSLKGFYTPNRDEALLEGKSYSKWGGFLEGFAEFDPLHFNIPPREVLSIDPQERIFMESCWHALEDAGYTKEQMAIQHNGNVGVFVGITKTGFNLYSADLWKQGKKIYLQTSFSSVANRISYILDLHGPSMPIDTMCSSSLTAIHEACEHIHRNECEMAIAGGVNLYLHPSSYVGLCSKQMLSSDGKCKSFGEGGDGFVPGEGVGAVILKPLAKAIEDNDNIYAVIRATGVNHGGKTNGYTVPNPIAQGKLIRETLDKAGIDARTVSYIEAHGTGTRLGDPIEITGLVQAFKKDTEDTGFCYIGSVKSNIGHLEAAAGIAGITKVVLQMKNKKIAPSLHSSELNSNINFGKTPFIVKQELEEWKRPIVEVNGIKREYPRIAGVSSFGAGGVNAHVIIEEYIEDKEEKRLIINNKQNDNIIVLSARNEKLLKQQVQQLLEEIVSEKFKDNDLPNIAYTLQIGRASMEERMAVKVKSISELIEKLKAFMQGHSNIRDLYVGQIKRYKEAIDILNSDEDLQNVIDVFISKKKYNKIMELWVKGLKVDWNDLHEGTKLNKISLPTYPFEKEYYWIQRSNLEFVHEEINNKNNYFQEPSVAKEEQLEIVKTECIDKYEQQALKTVIEKEIEAANVVNKPNNIVLQNLDDFSLQGNRHLVKARESIVLLPVTNILDQFGSKNVSIESNSEFISLKNDQFKKNDEFIQLKDEQFKVNYIRQSLQEELAISLADILSMKSSDIDVDTSFIDMGLDSIIGVEWIHLINKNYGLSISATKVYDYPSISEFTEFIKSELDKCSSVNPNSMVNREFKEPALRGNALSSNRDEKPYNESLNKRFRSNMSSLVSSEKALSNQLSISLAEFLLVSIDDIDIDTNFIDMGLDSIIGVEWIHVINKRYGLSVSATKIYDFPTIRQLSNYIAEQLNRYEEVVDIDDTKPNMVTNLKDILLKVEQGALDIETANKLFMDSQNFLNK